MINLSNSLKEIEHSPDKSGYIEKSSKKAYLLDDSNGIFSLLAFQHKGCLKIVDYIKCPNNDFSKVFLIELTDLQDDMRECIECEALMQIKSSDIRKYIKTLDKNGLKIAQKKLWMETVEEIKGKWMGSIAAVERLLRINQEANHAIYHLMIVLKNNTDPKDLDLFRVELNNKLSGMTGKIHILTTSQL